MPALWQVSAIESRSTKAMNYLYTILATTGAIIAAEIAGDYSLGDFLKDLVIRLIHGGTAAVKASAARLEVRLASIKARL